MSTTTISPGDIVQIVQERPGLVGAFLLVDEVRSWGVQGFVHNVESFEESNRIYLRLKWESVERIGAAVMMPGDLADDDQGALDGVDR